jgi:hypothetical protein
MEEWKTIEDFPNYEVSSWGNVRNKKRSRALKPKIHTSGKYITHEVILYNEDYPTGKHMRNHRLVALAFIPLVEGKDCVDHIDANPLNNRVENLHWVDKSENGLNPKNKVRSDNKLGERNISKHRDGFALWFQRNGIQIYGGVYKTLEEAVIKRNEIVDGTDRHTT